jgi:predicted nucleic acid-binding protein
VADAVLVDTDVMVDYLRGHRPAVTFIERHADRIVLSCVVVAELYLGVKGSRELDLLDELVSLFPVVPVTTEIARNAGLLKRDCGKSHGVGLADAILAATAQFEKAELKTLDVKHYPMLKGLKPPYTRR